jgi:hypothetical protein
VAENGGVLCTDHTHRALTAPIPHELEGALDGRGIIARHGEVLVACSAADEIIVLEEVRHLELECQLIRNRGELMVLPAGVSKGTGLLAALGELGVSHHNTIAIGDAENDHSLLEVAEVGAAVANAVPSLKEQADIVFDRGDGNDVISLLHSELLAGRARLHPSRWDITIGVDDQGQPVTLPGSQVNVLITGGTGDGKSFVSGLIAEQLIDLDYSLVVVDPEGDHIGLGALRGVIVVGGDHHLPPAAAVVPLLHHRYASVVVDLSSLDRDRHPAYLRALGAEIEAHRRATGLPQWIILDEAHRSVGRSNGTISVFDPAVKGHCLVTWQPDDLSANALASIDTVLALTNPRPANAIVDITAAIADVPRSTVARLLGRPTGQIVVARRDVSGDPILVQPASRATTHFRHEHKYASNGTDAAHRFYFRDDADQLTGMTASNLAELETAVATCGRPVLRHHCPHHDFSRWINDIFHDKPLSDTVRRLEETITDGSPAAVVESTRLALISAIRARSVR